ncbi:MAG: hypothetical protein LBN93_00925 [Candidatus Symbiothrix sp.]|jgi:hypothetical protein|nr:hypothetical protein [Candidatus Symbiothrix sp.]
MKKMMLVAVVAAGSVIGLGWSSVSTTASVADNAAATEEVTTSAAETDLQGKSTTGTMPVKQAPSLEYLLR